MFPYTLEDYVKTGEYKGIEVRVDSREATDADLQEKIDDILDVYSTFALSENYAAQIGDKLIIDFTGTMNGQTFQGGSGTSATVIVGSGSYIEGFEDGLIGAKMGDELELELTFPTDYDSALSGRDVKFDISVKSVYRRSVPEFNDSFVSSNFPYSTADEYKQALIEQINDTKPAEVDAKKLEDSWNNVRENFLVFNAPADDVQRYYQSNYSFYTALARTQNMKLGDYLKKQFGMSEAEFESMLQKVSYEEEENLIVALCIAKAEGLTVSRKLFKQKLEEYAVDWGYESSADFKDRVGYSMEEYYSPTVIYRYIFIDLAMEFVSEHAVEIPM